ncbi:MAG: FHA domain-containing protein [Planctomycetota bacterium]|jgi:anti-anti-sigma factor
MPTLALVRAGEMVASYRLDAPVVVLGRGDECGITLKGTLVSREHCRFLASGDTYVVEDLGSSNGTHVNGEPVERQVLVEGDRIAVVPHILVYHAADMEPLASPVPPEMDASAGSMDTARLDADEVNRHLSRLLAEAKAYGFSITQKTVGGDVDLIVISGPLDAHTADLLGGAFNARLAEGRCRFIADMSGVHYLASAGIGVLLSVSDETAAGGGKLVLLNPATQAQETLDLGFAELFTITGDMQEALAAVRAGG